MKINIMEILELFDYWSRYFDFFNDKTKLF